ncbi:alpha/beta-hydrolase [Penicillium angulare]|uniref:Alpha/beta-hydrolase n=1 Tax=Penicillium angulare TaxID=116970 RepID=A0A9W9KRV8_9EURO|nr:alpha/beta-hydrolase [Penicillium angulare]
MLSTGSDASLFYLPFFAARYLRPEHRQDPKWTYRQAIANTVLKVGLKLFTRFNARPGVSLKSRRLGDRFQLVHPAQKDFYMGVAEDKHVKPETIGATWYPKQFDPNAPVPDGEYVVLHLHGGSYIMGDGRPSSHRFMIKNILQHTPASYVFSVQYRLAGQPNCRFPAQLQDAISAYCYLIQDLCIPPSQIILNGDSSGGHLVLALLRYITQFNDFDTLPPPKYSWIWSPWCDVPASLSTDAWLQSPNYKTECIPACFPAYGASLFIGDLEITSSIEEYLVPLKHPFVLPSPIFLAAGGREVLCQDVKDLAHCFYDFPGNEFSVDLYIEHSVPHDVLMIGWIAGFQIEAINCVMEAGESLEYLCEAEKENLPKLIKMPDA